MRVLFTTLPGSGFLLPMVPLAWALRSAGHEVLVAANGEMAAASAQAGLPTVDVRPDIDLWRDFMAYIRREDGPPRGFGWFTEQTVESTVELAGNFGPDAVVTVPEQGAGGIVAGLLGIPWVEHGIRLASCPAHSHIPAAHRQRELDQLASIRARLGAPETPSSAAIDVRPPSLGGTEDDGCWSMKYLPYNGSRVLPDWVYARPSRPRVCVSLGTVAPEMDGIGWLTGLVAALSKMDIEVVLALGDRDISALGPLAPNVRTLGYLPLSAVLPTCSAIVHHGGAATTATPLVHGVPQFVIPGGADNPLNARLVREAGVAITCGRDEIIPSLLCDGMKRLLTESEFAERAAALRAEIAAQPGPPDIVRRLEQLVLEGKK
ncbi:DUF1205 domain-containing protein [Pseudonocardiaceae bacterium YIM PH 21723]|nr:DUF1205 domain-containing protein [Pseudonocardiaceae bacterium YIM PH 21723]